MAGYNTEMICFSLTKWRSVSIPRAELVCGLALLGIVASQGCAADPGAVQANLAYRVRCDTGCMDHTIEVVAIDQEGGARVSCSATPAENGNRLLTFAAYQDNKNGIELVGALFHPEGSGTVTGNGCSVKVRDDENDFRGGCRSSAPTTEDPCQVTNLKIEGSTVSGAILCAGLPGENTVGQLLNIASPSDADAPFLFSFANCRGL